MHGYEGLSARRDLVAQLAPSKPLWMSETGDGEASGMEFVKNLMADFQYLLMESWSYWQLADETAHWGLLGREQAGL